MSQEKEIKFPLSKRQRTKFENDYELIFLKKPVHNISDEKLVEAVLANKTKIDLNAKNSQQQPPQKATKNEGGKQINDEKNDGNQITGKVSEAEQRHFLNLRFKELFGIDAEENIPNDELRAMIISKENQISANLEYFDLFGKKPLDEMTLEQILSANENEKARIGEKNVKPKEKVEEIIFNKQTEMLIQKNGEKRVINKQTFPFIKHDGWEEVVETPSELLN